MATATVIANAACMVVQSLPTAMLPVGVSLALGVLPGITDAFGLQFLPRLQVQWRGGGGGPVTKPSGAARCQPTSTAH